MRRSFILPLFIWGSLILLPSFLLAGLRAVPQRMEIIPEKPDLRVERIQIVKNAWASELVTDLPFEVWVEVRNAGGALPDEQVEVRLKILMGSVFPGTPPLYESTLSLTVSNRTKRGRVHFRGIVIRGSELHLSGDSISIVAVAQVDPSNRVIEADEGNNKRQTWHNLYRLKRHFSLIRAYVERLRGNVVTLSRHRTINVRLVIKNTGNVMMRGSPTLKAFLIGGERSYEVSASPALRLRPGETTEARLVIRDVEPNTIRSGGVPQLAPYRLKALILPEEERGPSARSSRSGVGGALIPAMVIPPDHTFTSEPFYVEESEGHLYVKGIKVWDFKVKGSEVSFQAELAITGTGDGAWRRYRNLKIYFNIYRRGVPKGMQIATALVSKEIPEARIRIRIGARVALSDFLKRLFYDPEVTLVGIRAVLDEENYGEVLLSFRKNRWHVRSGPLSLSEDGCVQLSIPFGRSYDGDDISFQVRVDPACLRGKSSPGVMAYYSPEGAPYGARDAWDSCSGWFNEDVIGGRPSNFTARLGRCEWDRVKIGALFYWGPRGEKKFSKHARVILDHERVFERSGFRRMVRGRERTIWEAHPVRH